MSATVIDIKTRKQIANPVTEIRFQVGRTYRPAGNPNIVPTVTLARRTAKTGWFVDADGYTRRRRIDAETDRLGRLIEFVGLTDQDGLQAYEAI